MKVEEESKKAGLKLNIQMTKIIVCGPLTSWQIDGDRMETMTDFLWRLQNHCWWWLQPWNLKMLAPWKKSCDNPRQCIKKQRHPFADEGPSSQSYGFSSSHLKIWGLDTKKRLRTKELMLSNCDAGEDSWTARRSNQSLLKEINPEYSLEGLMLMAEAETPNALAT